MNMQILTTFVEFAVLISALVLLIMFVDAKARKWTEIEPLDACDSVLDRDAIERENELATALSKAQGEMNDAAKSSANPAPRSSITR